MAFYSSGSSMTQKAKALSMIDFSMPLKSP